MDDSTVAHRVVAEWLDDLDELESWAGTRRASRRAHERMGGALDGAGLIPAMRQALQSMARGEQALPAEVHGFPRQAADARKRLDRVLHGMDARRPPAWAEVRRLREGLLRLAVWRALRQWQCSTVRGAGTTGNFGVLLSRIAGRVCEAPPGVAASLDYAPRAASFFNGRVRQVLCHLAVQFPEARHELDGLRQQPDFEDTGVSVQSWSRCWTVAVAGIYIDWLRHHASEGLEAAMAEVWGAGAGCRRFKRTPPALPTANKGLRLDLWTGLVQAQVLAHDPKRFELEARGHRWHRVALALHDLSARDTHVAGSLLQQTVYRRLSVEMIYEVVFADCVTTLTEGTRNVPRIPAPTAPLAAAAAPLPFPVLAAAQQANLLFVQRWQGWTPGEPSSPAPQHRTTRRPQAERVLALSDAQRSILEGWRVAAGLDAPAAAAADPATLRWTTTARAAGARHTGQNDLRLGAASLWALAGPDGEWLELAVIIKWRGAWHAVPVLLQDAPGEDGSRASLWLEAHAPLGADVATSRLRAALSDATACRWCVTRRGLGAFVLCAIDLDRSR